MSRQDTTVQDVRVRLEAVTELARQRDRLEHALAVAKEEANNFPDDADILHRIGVIFRLCGAQEPALRSFKRVLEIQPSFHFAEIELGNICSDIGDKVQAIYWFRKAISSEPSYALAYIRAARLEHETGHSNAALKLLEEMPPDETTLTDRLLLYAELLQYHGRRTETVLSYEQAIDNGCEDPRVYFNYLRVLTEIGRYQKVIDKSHQFSRKSGSNPFVAAHCAVFSGHAKLALAVDPVQLVEVASARQRTQAWLPVDAVVRRLQMAIKQCSPLSLIRLGDGEARFLAFLSQSARSLIETHEAEAILNLIWENWFSHPLNKVSADTINLISARFSEALMGANILGITHPKRLGTDFYHRGYLGTLEDTVERLAQEHSELLFTDAMIHMALHRRSPFYRELLEGLPFIGVISPHAGLAERLSKHHGIRSFREYVIPGEARLPAQVLSRSGECHINDTFPFIMENLAPPFRGAVYIVAAGLLGKIYCNRVRELGGIAIDIGSIVDAWMGFNTRPGQFDEIAKWSLDREGEPISEREITASRVVEPL